MKSKRIIQYDLMKGLGIICVVIGHCGLEYGRYIIYMFHMPLFFFVSGCLHKQKRIDIAIKSKAISLLVPYLLFFFMTAILDMCLMHDSCDIWCHINFFSPSGSSGPLWFLICLFWCYLIYDLICQVFTKYSVIISLLASVCGYYLSINSISLPLYLDSACSCLIFYALGHKLSSMHRMELPDFAKMGGLIISVGLLFVLYFIDFKLFRLGINDLYCNKIMNNYLLFIISSLIGIMAVDLLSIVMARFESNLIVSLFAYFGSMSLYIFAFHMMFLNIMQIMHFSDTPLFQVLYAVISFALSIVVGHIVKEPLCRTIKWMKGLWLVS